MRKIITLLLLTIFAFSACSFLQPQQKPASPPQVNQQSNEPIENKIKRDIDKFNGHAGIFAKNLQSGKAIAINEDKIFPTASTHKLVVALATYKYLYANVSTEKKKQYDEHIRKMMQVSDNPSFHHLLREIEKLKPDALSQVLRDLQLKSTWVHSEDAFRKYGYHSVTTPKEMAVIFEAIYRENYLGKEMSVILKEELAKTIFKDEIPRFMQKNKVMHKVGSLPGMLCDVGIIDDGKDQILISIYTTSKQPEKQSSLFIAETSAKLYKALSTK